MEILKYLFYGIVHYLSLLFGMLDFIDLQFMFAIIIILLIISLINKIVRKSILVLFKPMIKILFNPFALLIFIPVVSYYIYITINFEEQITPILFIFTLYLFFKDYFKSYLNISSVSVKSTIKDFNLSVLLLTFYQVVLMFENGNISILKTILMSLIFIPIFSGIIIMFKYLICFEVIRAQWEGRIKLSFFELLKLYTFVLIKSKNYSYIQYMNDILSYNKNSTYKEIKKLIANEIIEKNNQKGSESIKKPKMTFIITKFKKVMFISWIFILIIVVLSVIEKRFNNINFDFYYYFSMTILYIVFWVDLMKNKGIENNYDWGIYMCIYIFLILVIIFYKNTLTGNRLSELAFTLPMFIFFRIKSLNKRFPNITTMPFLSQKNFFGLNPNNYVNKNSKNLTSKS